MVLLPRKRKTYLLPLRWGIKFKHSCLLVSCGIEFSQSHLMVTDYGLTWVLILAQDIVVLEMAACGVNIYLIRVECSQIVLSVTKICFAQISAI